MTYYPTLAEDLQRAKEILVRGKEQEPDRHGYGCPHDGDAYVEPVPGDCCCIDNPQSEPTGTIYGADTFAAYKLLESFVAELDKKPEQARDAEEALRRVASEVRGAPSMLLYDGKSYKVIPTDLANWIEKLV